MTSQVPDSPPDTLPRKKKGWRSKHAKRRPVETQHRWQKTERVPEDINRWRSRRIWYQSKIGLLLALVLGLLGLFIAILVYAPAKTVLITNTSIHYGAPLPPNTYASEDLRRLQALDGDTFDVVALTDQWRSAGVGMRHLELQIQKAVTNNHRQQVIVLWFSMHGAIDDQGEPCLVPPGSQPTNSATWLRVRNVLSLLKTPQVPSEFKKLVLFDCNRIRVDPDLGLVYNDFAEQLIDVVEESGVPNLAVINSVSPGQAAWDSPDLRASVFGFFTQQALQGACDLASEMGNEDQSVSVAEIYRFLRHHVSQWVRKNRQDIQEPMLLPSDAQNFEVSWALNPSFLALDTQPLNNEIPLSVSTKQLDTLWKTHDSLERKASEFPPLKWRDYQQGLMRLEQLALAGMAYESDANSLMVNLNRQASQLKPRSSSLSLAAHNLPLAEKLGRLPESPEEILKLRAHIDPTMEKPKDPPGPTSYPARVKAAWETVLETRDLTPDLLQSILKFVALPSADFAPGLIEHHYLRMLQENLASNAGDWPGTPSLKSGSLLQQSFQSRNLAETLSTPNDVRTHYWLMQQIDQGDTSRRLAEDSLFIGQKPYLIDAEKYWKEAQTTYQSATSREQIVSAAYTARDIARAEIPYLADWLMTPLPPSERKFALDRDREINQKLLPLIDATDELDQLLQNSLQTAAENVEGFQEQTDRVNSQLTSLRQVFFDECNRLASQAPFSPETYRDITSVLAIPLVPATQRNQLRQKALNFSHKLAIGFLPTSTASGERDEILKRLKLAEVESEWSYLDRQTESWKIHPVIRILSTKEQVAFNADLPPRPQNPNATQLAQWRADQLTVTHRRGQAIRRWLGSISSDVQQLLKDSDLRLTDPNQRTFDVRDLRSRAAQQVQKAACYSFPLPPQNPLDELFKFDLHHLLVWQAERTIRDFWGAAEGQPEDFFMQAGAGYLDSSRRLCQSETGLAPLQDKPISQLWESYREVAKVGIQPQVSNLLFFGEAAQVAHSALLKVPPGLPDGRAAFFLESLSEQSIPVAEPNRDPVARLGVEVPLGSRSDDELSVPFVLSTQVLLDKGPSMNALTLYRGHRWTTPFYSQPNQGTEIVYNQPKYPDPIITAYGNAQRPASLVVILDCSASMAQPAQYDEGRQEGGQGNNRPITRMDVAKQALSAMLAQMSQKGNYRVGVYFYGHRVGRDTSRPPYPILEQTTYGRPIPPNLIPPEDVEEILPLGRFEDAQLNEVQSLLQTVKAWGETPLYLSIIEAIGAFAQEDPQRNQNIIVITDGRNDVYNATDPKTLQDVLSLLNRRNISVDIVGFQLEDSQRDAAEREFNRIASQSGGDFYRAQTATSLLQALQKRLGPTQYYIKDSMGRVVLDDNARQVGRQPLGYPVQIPLNRPNELRFSTKNEYSVLVDTESANVRSDVELEGGEGLELFLTPDNKKLVFRRYDKGDPLFSDPIPSQPEAPRRFIVGAHRPTWLRGDLNFPISLQRFDATQFTPRPPEVWIEITPILSGGLPGDPYTFYQRNFVVGESVPILQATARSWPQAAKKADVNFWWNESRTNPNMRIKVSDAIERQKSYPDGMPVTAIPNVTFKVQLRPPPEDSPNEPLRVVVIEDFTQDAEDIYMMRTEMNPPAAQTTHRYDAEHRLVVHTFLYPNISESIVQNYQILFTSRRDIQKDAWHVAKPLRIDIPELTDVIPFSTGN
ncbi:Hypothetical protein PBC10988_15650 [Planctomycetales bacterium 10988]|nr:Hypothetical protein PBC10988_15650 [Planctomycetales bacterium 10988]